MSKNFISGRRGRIRETRKKGVGKEIPERRGGGEERPERGGIRETRKKEG
jgi:hypothetical protein